MWSLVYDSSCDFMSFEFEYWPSVIGDLMVPVMTGCRPSGFETREVHLVAEAALRDRLRRGALGCLWAWIAWCCVIRRSMMVCGLLLIRVMACQGSRSGTLILMILMLLRRFTPMLIIVLIRCSILLFVSTTWMVFMGVPWLLGCGELLIGRCWFTARLAAWVRMMSLILRVT